MAFQLLLVATDFGELAGQAEARALELARSCGARCVLLHVIEAIEGTDEGGPADPEVEAFYARLRQRGEAALAERAERFRAAGLDCQREVRVGRRWQVIVERAEQLGADLVVLGSHPPLRQGERPQLGTVSHQVFLASGRSVLLVRG